MVETSKQVRVDNWGIYFLQRLQLFFSKTDYCDLTLQFEGNVQLKVHRLVMNACTEYFAFLEQTCPALEENTIMMPSDLQADVIVPIVNFMYTGMLEFHPSIYDKLYKAAEIMNIAVLTKLLEAQLAPVSKMTSRAGKREKNPTDYVQTNSWKEVKKPPKPALPLASELPATLPAKKAAVWKKRNLSSNVHQSHPSSATFTNKWTSDPVEKDTISASDNTPKPTRFEWPDEDLAPLSAMYPTFDEVSLTSKPLWTKDDEHKPAISEDQQKIGQYPERRNSHNSVSQDYDEEFIEKEQKVNVSQLEEAVPTETPNKRKAETKTVTSSPKRVKITNQDEETVISITTSNPNEVDHTKIVSEILKKYPDLVKKKRNIKLKITQSKTEQAQIKVQTYPFGRTNVEKSKPAQLPSPVEKPQSIPPKEVKRELQVPKESPPLKELGRRGTKKAIFKAASEDGPWTCMDCFAQDREGAEFVLYYLFRKHMADHHNVEFDSTLCKYCGKKCPKENLMVYHLYTKHGLKPPRDVAFPKCNHCPFIAATTDRIQEHIKTHAKDEVQCPSCQLGFETKRDLVGHHRLAGHTNRVSSILDCAYCKKKLQSPVTLFTHVRGMHMKEARRDGVTSLDENMDIQEEDIEDVPEREELVVPQHDKNIEIEMESIVEDKPPKERVKIISNVKVAKRPEDSISENAVNKITDPTTLRAPEPETVAVTTTATTLSNIGGSLGTNIGLVDIVVLDDNQQYILQQPPGQGGNTEFILPPELTGSEGILQAAAASGELNSTDELVMVLTDHDYQDDQNQGQSDNSNIVVLYSHPVEGQQGQFITSQGNLLVNSDGMLEIRNGAAITTTAGQILVNSDNTTTTQSNESPIESIDLIRKEIERSDDVERERESIKTVLRKKGKEINKIENEIIPPPQEITQNHSGQHLDNNYDDAKKDVQVPIDTTDSSTEEVPMEVDEIIPQQKEVLPEENENVEQKEHQLSIIEHQSIEHQSTHQVDEQPESIEASNNEISTEEEQGQDVPPDIITTPEDEPLTEQPTPIPNELVLNDPNNFEFTSAPMPDEEQMEVDGVNSPAATNEEQYVSPGLDEVDTEVPEPENPEIPSIIDNNDETPLEDCPEENQTQELLLDQPIQEEIQNEEVQEQIPILEEEDQNQRIEIIENLNLPEGLNESIPENIEQCNLDNLAENHVESQQEELEQPTGNEVNDSNDNIQQHFDDFTDESQQSSEQKLRKDVNKEILDDWDDTDSQQSQSQEQDSQESEQDSAVLNAAENVNKLMDDWDDEDEDQTKE